MPVNEAARSTLVLPERSDIQFEAAHLDQRLSGASMRTAFALAGLGGFNAHGAGFLAAAKAWDIQPELVTATSGQILVLADWLHGDADLNKSLVSPGRDGNPVAQLQTLLFGYPGVFKPAYQQTLARFASWPNFRQSPLDIFADRFLPAQQYVPDRPEASFQAVADTFNTSAIGVLFNSYDLAQGKGVLYGNDVARQLMPKAKAVPSRHAASLTGSPPAWPAPRSAATGDTHLTYPPKRKFLPSTRKPSSQPCGCRSTGFRTC